MKLPSNLYLTPKALDSSKLFLQALCLYLCPKIKCKKFSNSDMSEMKVAQFPSTEFSDLKQRSSVLNT